MLTIVATQEDAKRYTEPAKWYYEQLMPLCGFKSPKQLRAAIRKATSLGWLVYEHGSKGVPNRFHVSIPESYDPLTANGCDEPFFTSDSEVNVRNETFCTSDSEAKRESQTVFPSQNGNECAPKGERKGNASIPSPSPKKDRHIFVPPTIEEWRSYWIDSGLFGNPDQSFDHYQSVGWTQKSGQSLKDWRATARVASSRQKDWQATSPSKSKPKFLTGSEP
jgi:hypothetical protein